MILYFEICHDEAFGEITGLCYNNENEEVRTVLDRTDRVFNTKNIGIRFLASQRHNDIWYFLLYKDGKENLKLYLLGNHRGQFPYDEIRELVIKKSTIPIDDVKEFLRMLIL